MATRPQTTNLTEQHRQAQLQVRASAIRDFLLLWPLWHPGDDASFVGFARAAMPLVRSYHSISAAVAASYYRSFRAAERVPGAATTRLAAAPVDAQVTASLYVTGQVANRNALKAGQRPDDARKAALVGTTGAVTRLLLQGGREAILQSVAADPHAIGWARVTDGDPCAFCLTLASRGAVYKTEETAGFQAHDSCGCTAMPLWEGTTLPPSTERWKSIYDLAQRAGEASGDLNRGENTPQARINAVRRYLAGR